MSWSDEYFALVEEDKKKKKKKKTEETAPVKETFETSPYSAMGRLAANSSLGAKRNEAVAKAVKAENIAPVTPQTQTGRLWDDGDDSGYVSKTILGTADELNTFRDKLSQAQKTGNSTDEAKYQYLFDQSKNKYTAAKFVTKFSDIKMDGTNRSVYEEAKLVAAMEEGEEKEKRKKALLKKIKSIQASSKWDGWLDPFDDGVSAGEIAPFLADTVTRALSFGKTYSDGYDENEVYAMLTGEVRDASLADVTVNSFTRGYNNSLYGEESYDAMMGTANEKEKYEYILAGDKYNFKTDNWFESAVAGAAEQLGQQFRQYTNPNTLATAGAAAGAVAIAGQAGPQVLAPEEVVTVPTAALVGFQAGSAAQALKIEAGLAYNEMIEAGISEKTAKAIAVGVGTVNAGLEAVQLDELVKAFKVTKANGATKSVTKMILDEIGKRGVDVAKETAQEVAQEAVTMGGVQLGSKIDTGEDAYTWDEAGNRLWDTAKSSALTFGLLNAPATVNNSVSIAQQHKAETKLTDNEQKVLDKLVADEIAEAEKDGKVTAKQKAEIYDKVRTKMEKGYISIGDIESILGGETYKTYKDTLDSENALTERQEALQKELDDINSKPWQERDWERIDEIEAELAEINPQIEANKTNSKLSELQKQLSDEVFQMTAKDKRLRESYKEIARKYQKIDIDPTQYSGAARKTAESIVNAEWNNTNVAKDAANLLIRVSEDQGIPIETLTAKEIAERGFGVEGKTVNGANTKDGIIINWQSKKYLNSTVGHEITHVLKKSGLYEPLRDAMKAYSEAKGDYQSRYDSTKDLYTKKDKDGNAILDADGNATYLTEDGKVDGIEEEVIADLVGDYLFTDQKFVDHLLATDEHVFKKVWNEVKYFVKIATAGSEEHGKLLEAQRAFERAYNAKGKVATGTQHSLSNENSLSDSDGKELSKGQQEYFKDSKMRDENGNLKVMYHGSQDAGFHVFDPSMSDDDISFFFVDRNDVAASYSGTTETYEAKAFKTAEDANKFFESIGKPEYEVIEKDGKYRLREDEGSSYYTVAESESLEEIYQEFCDYEGVGYGDANYKVYLNLKNPLVLDAEGRNWDMVTRDYSQEAYDKYQSLTAEEKAALTDIAEWEDFGTFRDAWYDDVSGTPLASAHEKLGNVDVYDLFSIVTDDFSEESLKEYAVKNMNTRDYAKKAKAEGYDGVIFKNIVDIGGYGGEYTPSTVAIAFDSNQIKSTANTEPTANKDIRYSVSEAQNENGLNMEQEVVYSISKDTEYADSAIAFNDASKNVDATVLDAAKRTRAWVADRLREMQEKGVALPPDIEGDTWFEDKAYGGSMENTLVCPRSLAPEAFMDAVSKTVGRPLTVKEQIYVGQELMSLMTTSEELRGQAFLAQCVYCYVAADRMAQREFLGEYIKQRDAVLEKIANNPNVDVSQLEADHAALAQWWENKKGKKPELSEVGKLYQEFLKKRKPTGATYERFKMWVEAYTNGSPMIDGNHLASIEELTGDLSQFDPALIPQIKDAWKYAQSASWAKKRTSYTAYNGQILEWDDDLINALNEHYGMRMYSFSDYHPAFVLENMQMITDAAVRGLKTLAYTKDLDFAEIFAPSHANINISTFGFEKGGNVYEDNQMGADWKKAQALRAKYPNVGITFVATNDTITEWALQQDWIDVVIPYHMVKTGKIIADYFGYKNYTKESSDKKTSVWRKDKAWKESHDSSIAPTGHNNDLETYLAALEANGLKPRFERFLKNPATSPYYMKLVNECRLSASMSRAVEPKFDENAIQRTLARLETEGYYTPIGGSVERMYEIAAGVAENIPVQNSLSEIGEQPIKHGDWHISGEDLVLQEIAPVNPSVDNVEAVGENVPVSEAETVAPVAEKATSHVLYSGRDGKNGWGKVYATAQEALNDAVKSVNPGLWDAIDEEIENSVGVKNADTPMVNALIAVQEDVRQSTITPMQGAQLLSEAYSHGEAKALRGLYNPKTGNLYDRYLEKAKQYESTVPTTDMFPDDLSPMEDSLERLASLDDSDAPPEADTYYGEEEAPVAPRDPFESRDFKGVGKRNVHAYMYDNPEVKPFFQMQAKAMLGDLQNSVKGERWYNDDVYYESGGEYGWSGTERQTTDDIAYLLDMGYTYAQIEKGLNDIIEDNGAENNAMAKRIEFALNDRLSKGYTDINGVEIPANEEYLNVLAQKEAAEVAEGQIAPHTDADAPMDDIAPVKEQPVKETAKKTEPKVAKVKVNEEVKTKKTFGEKVRGAWDSAKQTVNTAVSTFGDKGWVFENLAKKTKNRELEAKYNFLHYSESRAQEYIKDNLMPIVERVKQTGKTEDVFNYVYHLHNIDRMSLETDENRIKREGLRENFKGLTDKQIESIAMEWIKKDTPDDVRKRIKLAREYIDSKKGMNKPVFGESVTADVSREAVKKYEAENPEFKELESAIVEYNRQLRKMLVDGNVISQKTADMWEKMYPHYVPIRRTGKDGLGVTVPLDTNKTGVNAPIKRATGGDSDIEDLFETMVMRTEQTFKAIAKNSFGVELMHTLDSDVAKEKTTLDSILDSFDSHEELLQEGKNGKSPTFTVFEDGKRVTFDITQDMYDALKPTSEKLAKVYKIPNKLSGWHRAILTDKNPVFLATNAIKDAQDVMINSQHAGKTYLNFPVAIKELASQGHWFKEYMANGGEQNTYFDSESKTFKGEDEGVKNWLNKISEANNFVERIPRLAEYIASRKMGKSIEVSMLDAARVTTNFAAGADVTKFLNRNGFTFLNASVQGAMQQVRNVREANTNGLKGWAMLAGKVAGVGLAHTILNHLLWDDDEDYEELSDYVKQNYYIVAKTDDGTFIRIPKGRTMAVIQEAFTQMENLITGDDEVDLGNFAELVISNLAPNNPLDNNIIAPVAQAVTNRTWYGEDLVPTRLQDMPDAEQYDESTDLFSKWLGEKTDFSPYKINYLLNQYSGGIGDVFLPMMTPEAESGDGILGKFVAPWKDKFSTDSVMKNQNVTDFYDKVDELTVNANSSKATDDDILMSKYMSAVNSELSDLYKQKREIQNSDMSDAEKYAEVRAIQQQIDDLAENALGNYENINRDGDYAEIGDVYFQWYTPEKGDPYWRKLTDSQKTKYLLTKDATGHYVTDGNVHYRLDEAGEWTKISDKQLARQNEVTKALGITPDEYWSKTEISFLPMSDGEYEYAYDNPENYAVAKAVGGYDSYRKYSKELYNIKADKDSNGKSISGSRKKKVVEYINNLDADYGEKIILYKSEYPSDDTYNYEIVEYLNGRSDISYEEMKTILEELGAKVDSQGNISWD